MYNKFKNIYTEYLKHIIFGGKGALFLKKKNSLSPTNQTKLAKIKNW